MEKPEHEKFLDDLAAKWPSSVVGRKVFVKFSGGVFAGRTLANMDSRGDGIPGRFLLGGQVVYPLENAVQWLKAQSSPDWKSRKKGADI